MIRRLHALGRWPFMRLEHAFNAAFGDKLNPLYHLGSIAFFLCWIAVGTGLYLYVFFKTGVAEAYASVEALTHGQWYAGGVMRSLHRYASDALVLTMALHMARHFFFDRYRGFRWFSWVTGVVLIWFVYVSGIGGYMLPWDRLAQFVTVASAEWLDWLPVFRGALVRNFIVASAVNDRLFSLLSFLHIGVPLVMLLVMWVHVQRVPGASTNPPREIAIPLAASLTVLSLVAPALSQGPADLGRVPARLDFDWFYLPTLALLYEWSAGAVWALLVCATAALVALPWLPPARRRGATRAFHVLVRPDNRIVPIRAGETLLEAGLREGLPMPFDCRNGGCGVCKATVLYGEVDAGVYQPEVLPPGERALGRVLTCCATARSDLEIEYEPAAGAAPVPVRVYEARVARMLRLSHDVMQIFLEPISGEPPEFYAGQYLNILLDDGQKRAYSFATAPGVSRQIELHVRQVPGGQFTTHVFTAMKEGDRVRFEGPLGSFFLREDSTKPIIFVAGSTGFAPVKSMLEHAFRAGVRREMRLYWGVRRRRDFYMSELPERWAREHPNFRFVPVLSDPEPEDAWAGRTGLVHHAILEDYPDLSGHQLYACGSVAMVEAAHPAFKAHGITDDDCFSDAFRAAPRRQTPQGELVHLAQR